MPERGTAEEERIRQSLRDTSTRRRIMSETVNPESPQFPIDKWIAERNPQHNDRWVHIRNTLDTMIQWEAIQGYTHYVTNVRGTVQHWVITDTFGKSVDHLTGAVEQMILKFCQDNGIVWRPVVYRDTASLQRIQHVDVLYWMQAKLNLSATGIEPCWKCGSPRPNHFAECC